MSTYKVTIDVTDFARNGIVPRLAFVTFSRLTVDDNSSEIVTTAPISVRVTQTPAIVQLEAGVTYKVRGDGIAGVGTFYASASADCSLADFRDEHQIDPITQSPVAEVVTVGEAIASVQQQLADFIWLDAGDDATTASALAARPTTTAVNQLIAAQAVSDAATYVALRGAWAAGTTYLKNSVVIQGGVAYLAAADVPARATFTAGDWIALSGGGSAPAAVTAVDNGDGTITYSGTGVVDNGDGTFTLTGSNITDNGDGTYAVAA